MIVAKTYDIVFVVFVTLNDVFHGGDALRLDDEHASGRVSIDRIGRRPAHLCERCCKKPLPKKDKTTNALNEPLTTIFLMPSRCASRTFARRSSASGPAWYGAEIK